MENQDRGLSKTQTSSTQLLLNGSKVLTTNTARDLTLVKAQDSAQLSGLNKEMGPEVTLTMVSALLNEVSKFVNHQLHEEDLVSYAELILVQHWDLRIDELTLICFNGISGRYGKIYGSFNYQTLTEWIEIFKDYKLDWITSEHEAKKERPDYEMRSVNRGKVTPLQEVVKMSMGQGKETFRERIQKRKGPDNG